MTDSLDLLTDPHPLLTPSEAAALLKLSPKTLERYRRTGDGPPFVTVGPRLIRYRRADLQAHLDRRVFTNTVQRKLPR